MEDPIRFRPELGHTIESGAKADSRLCWTCGSCDSECPVNIATGRLRPRNIVRMASLGMLEELLCHPEIWYCLTCRRCEQICPNAVKPSAIIEYLRMEMISREWISWETFQRYRDLFARFQRVRWRAAAACLGGDVADVTQHRWQRWLEDPLPVFSEKIISGNVIHAFNTYRGPMERAHIRLCFTCGECSSACPIACHRDVFDPRTVFRMAHLGLEEELFRSPALWLCLGCGRCTDACTQTVDGCEIIQSLRAEAIESGAVDRDLVFRIEASNRNIFPWFLEEVDRLLGHSTKPAAGCLRRAYA